MSGLTQSPRLSPFAVFRNRSFTYLWVAQFISRLGSGLTTIAAGLLIYRLTGSALHVGLMLIAATLPSLLVGLIAGVVVDRYDRRRIMIAADLVRAVLVALVPLLVSSSIAWLYVIVLLSSAVNQFFDPANESVLPEVASDEELAAANALMTISFTAAETIGFAAAGLIAARFSIAWAFYLDACTFVVSALCIMRLRITPLATDGASTAAMAFHQFRAGLRFVADAPALRSLLLLFVPVFIIFGYLNALLLPFADRALHADAFVYGLLEGLPVLGSVAGSLVMAVVAERLHAGQWIATSLLGMGLLFMIVAQMTSTPLVIGMLMVVHFAHTPAYLGRRLLLQRNTEREVRGRVNSVFFVSRDVAYLLGMGASGLADYVNVRLLYLAGGAVLLLAGMWALRLPGLSQPRAEWRRRLASLRTPIEVAS